MRKAFFQTLASLTERDSGVYLLTGDLGFGVFDSFQSSHAKTFVNVGVAEANMIGISAGLALSGKKVYCYSIIPFLLMRAYEQIRVDVAYNGLAVRLIGTGGGFSYGLEGFTHYGLEDLALMRVLPNMTVVVPADACEAKQLAALSLDFSTPLYVRLGKAGDPVVHKQERPLEIGKGMVLAEGRQAAVIAAGSMVFPALQAVETLRSKGLAVTLVDMHTIRPLDVDLVRQCASTHELIVTVEEHSITGGLGSAVAEMLCEDGYKGAFRRMGIPERLQRIVGDAEYLKLKYGLGAEGISTCVVDELEGASIYDHKRAVHRLSTALSSDEDRVARPL